MRHYTGDEKKAAIDLRSDTEMTSLKGQTPFGDPEKGATVANKVNSLSHAKRMRKYHIVFTPEYKHKVICVQFDVRFAGCS